jgi:hypothetical protein
LAVCKDPDLLDFLLGRAEFLSNKIDRMRKRKWLPGGNTPGRFTYEPTPHSRE